jgi:hypothetical protein
VLHHHHNDWGSIFSFGPKMDAFMHGLVDAAAETYDRARDQL